MRQLKAQATTANDYDIALPDDFGGIDGPLTYATADACNIEIPIVPEVRLRMLRQNNTTTGYPSYAATRMINTFTGASGLRWELLLFPTPNAAYTLSFRYKVLPGELSDALPYPYGGAAHSETILEACLSVAEQRMDDEAGLHTQLFAERLAASIAQDQRNLMPEFFGYNRDGSDQVSLPNRYQRTDSITYNSTLY
jgi:hypothetical protein